MRGQRHAPAALPPGKTRYRRLGGPQGRSRQVRKIAPPPGFDPRTVQPVGSRYNDCATRPTNIVFSSLKHSVCFVSTCVNFSMKFTNVYGFFFTLLRINTISKVSMTYWSLEYRRSVCCCEEGTEMNITYMSK
jgi:hypothetical protein